MGAGPSPCSDTGPGPWADLLRAGASRGEEAAYPNASGLGNALIIINRALVYGTLTTCVVGLYILIVGGAGALLRTGGNLAISLVAAGVVAVLFQPLRERLQRG